MKNANIVKAFLALGHDTRLSIFKYLAKKGKEGVSAGDIGAKFGVPGATLSFHLNQLSNAKLISSRKEGRAVFYYVKFKRIKKIMEFMSDNMNKKDSKKDDIDDQEEELSSDIKFSEAVDEIVD